MDDPFWRSVEELFHAALQQPESGRDAWVAAQSELNPAVRDEARSLLAADRREAELSVPSAAAGHAADCSEQESPAAAHRFGPYVTVRLLGGGGMGAVYLARRADGQFDQIVALKVIAPHLAGEEFVRSFRNERQMLAALAHPNIARLLDGGVTSGGAPYLVMEYVEGQLWDRYCADRKPPVEARIRLFLQVCDAVEYAHQNLIVHGDLKPANIIVTADGTVKLLDFGTAKLVHDPEGRVTQFASLTPRYASPEQLRGERVNTLSDVFALGVILYELLTGAWPFGDPKSLLDRMDRVMHGTDLLRRQVAGDLATIVLKMLEMEPTRRYGSVREAKEDLERFCQGRPVLARPHSAWYTARRFAARHWLAVPATLLSVIALAGLTVISVYESAQAKAHALRAERVSEFAKNTFLSASSYWNSPLRVKHDAIEFSDILDNAAARVGRELGSDPAAEADLRATLGFTYAVLGEPAKGEAQMLLGLQLLGRIPGGAPLIAANIYTGLCDARSFQGHYREALEACRKAEALYRATDTRLLGGVLHDSAYMSVNAGEGLPEVEKLYRAAGKYPHEGQSSFQSILNSRLGLLRMRQGDLAGGELLLNEAEPELSGPGEPMVEIVPVWYARAFEQDVRGRYAEAARLMSQALDLVVRKRAAFMEPDELTLQLAAYEALAGDRGALPRLRSVEQRLSQETAAPVKSIRHGLFMGIVEAHYGSKAAAERDYRAALATQEKEMSKQPDIAVELCVRLMELLRATGRQAEAVEVARQGLSAARQAYGEYYGAHPFVLELQRASAGVGIRTFTR